MPPTKQDLENAVQAYVDASERSKAAANKALEYLEKSQQMGGIEIFENAAKRMLLASENYRSSSDLALKVVQEIRNKFPNIE